jgi:hypothetical protein
LTFSYQKLTTCNLYVIILLVTKLVTSSCTCSCLCILGGPRACFRLTSSADVRSERRANSRSELPKSKKKSISTLTTKRARARRLGWGVAKRVKRQAQSASEGSPTASCRNVSGTYTNNIPITMVTACQYHSANRQ